MRVEIERLYVDERGITRVLARAESDSKPGVWGTGSTCGCGMGG
jgi:hypothetical protein